MASKTFCDRCHIEIPLVKGRISKYVLTIEHIDEPGGGQYGDVHAEDQLKKEVCARCRAAIGRAIAFVLKK